METLTCSIAWDLLPLYVDEAVSPATREELEAHLAGCPACRRRLSEEKGRWEAARLVQEIFPPQLAAPPKRRRTLRVLFLVLLANLLLWGLVGLYNYLSTHTLLASSGEVEITTGFYESDFYDSPWGQEWAALLTVTRGPALTLDYEVQRADLGDGTMGAVNTTVHVYKKWFSSGCSGCHMVSAPSFSYEDLPAMEDYEGDFTLTLVFSDKAIVYSLTDAGFLRPQQTQPQPTYQAGHGYYTPMGGTADET